jgi:phenylpropionate dioxygenase-like ring-hydroxylating dioxygenase large terminal subunit
MGSISQVSTSGFDIGDGRMFPDPSVMETGHVSMQAYISPERFQRECDLFGRIWLNIGREEEIPKPGDWIVREITCRSASIILTRDTENTIRAFHNVCSHRGMKLLWSDKSNAKKLSCPYHGWTYDSTGALVGVPDKACFPHVHNHESGLTPVACDIWEGFIFVNLQSPPKLTLRELLGPLTDRLAGAPFGQYRHATRMAAYLPANWKFGIEAACEAYHVRVLHKRSVSDMIASADNPFCHFLNWETVGAHRTASWPGNPNFAPSSDKPVQRFAFASAPMVVATGPNEESKDDLVSHPGINIAQHANWATDQFSIFPNILLNVGLSGWWIHRYWPISVAKSKWESIFYSKAPRTWRERFALSYYGALQRDIMSEDNCTFEALQFAMSSGAKQNVQLGEQEALVKHHAAVLETLCGDTTRHSGPNGIERK